MNRLHAEIDRLGGRVTRWLARWSVTLLRISLGLVFLGFGALKFFPGVSPAEALAEQAVDELTLGLLPENLGLLLV
ncbi:MAG: DoxX family protein, partial [Chloroflexota bacterium]